MGESKRRKQSLGNDYGKTPAVLKDGSKQLDDHLEKFALALSHKMDELGADLDIGDLEGAEALEAMESEMTPEEAREKSQELKTWIRQYLQPYRPQDQEKLAIGLLNPIYEDIFDFAKEHSQGDPSEASLELFMLNVVHALSAFSIVKSLLSPENQEMFAGPMRELYTMMAEDLKEGANQERQDLANLFAPCLDKA
jgi:hypothetical protein